MMTALIVVLPASIPRKQGPVDRSMGRVGIVTREWRLAKAARSPVSANRGRNLEAARAGAVPVWKRLMIVEMASAGPVASRAAPIATYSWARGGVSNEQRASA